MILTTIHHDTLVTLCDQISDLVIALDHQGRISFLNPAAEAALKLDSASLTNRAPTDIPEMAPLLAFIARARANHTALRERVTLPDGRMVWVQIVPTLRATSPVEERPRITNMMGEIVHEMKRPLSSAKSLIDLIEATGTLSEQQELLAQKARLRLAAMLNQFHQIEDMAWLDTNGHLQTGPVDMESVIRRALTHLEGFAQQQGVTITVDIQPPPCRLEGDAVRLESVFGNLIHNAIKYSPDGGHIVITSSADDSRVAYGVTDQGLGISHEHIPHLFEQFYRVRDAATARIEGSGLGLSIVKTIVEKHGGEVFVESTPGEGSTFGFWLPCE